MNSHAAVVTLSGGFTSYAGPVIHIPALDISTQLTPTVGGVVQPSITVLPTLPITGRNPATIGLGFADFTAGGTRPLGAEAVDFQRVNVGSPVSNRISFTPGGAANVAVGDEFLLGTFSLINGDWFGDLPDSEFAFRLVTSSADAALHDHTFAGILGFHVTSRCSSGVCSSDPAVDADQFYFKERPDLGRVTVLELNAQPGVPNSGTVSLYGRIGSLIPTRFTDATGGVVLLPAAQPVPEPGAWALCLMGLGLIHLVVRTRRQPA